VPSYYGQRLYFQKRIKRKEVRMTAPLRSVLLRQMILDVEDAMKTKTPAQISAEFPEYQKEFPNVFAKLLEKDYRRDILAMMVDQLDKMERGLVTQHNASVAVGTVIVDRIVKPQIRGTKS
jgi:ABC-type transporter MlaC component